MEGISEGGPRSRLARVATEGGPRSRLAIAVALAADQKADLDRQTLRCADGLARLERVASRPAIAASGVNAKLGRACAASRRPAIPARCPTCRC
jgi:hypothetical protein